MHIQFGKAASAASDLPYWVPESVRAYLAHVQGGDSLRALARANGCHASTVLRQVRNTETLRDDPLADAALTALETLWQDNATPHLDRPARRGLMGRTDNDKRHLDRDTRRALKALCEPGTLLVIADGVEDAVIVANSTGDCPVRRLVLPREVAEIMALKRWIEGGGEGRIARYRITPEGRAELGRRVAEAETARMMEGQAPDLVPEEGEPRKTRTAGAEPPLRVLARRRRADGTMFLDDEMVRAAERFRLSFEIARVGGHLDEDLEPLLSGRLHPPTPLEASDIRPEDRALHSLTRAVRCLGPDLSETVILSCCRETGMEAIEAGLELPARSGKIILRIALKMLIRHYAAMGDEGLDMVY